MILAKKPEVHRFLAAPPAHIRIALIHGKDRGGVRERADTLAARVTDRPDDPFDVALLVEGDVDGDPARLADELSALSMTGGRRLVRLRLGEKAAVEKATAEALKAHAQGLYNPDAFLLIESDALDRGSALRKAAEGAQACAAVAIYDDEAGDVARLAREALAAEGLRLSPEALDLFVSRLPHERGVARQEIERLILYLGPKALDPKAPDPKALGAARSAVGAVTGPQALEAFLGVEPEASLYDAAADAFGGRLAPAFHALRRAHAEGESGPAAVRALSSHLQKLRRALTLAAGGLSPAVAAKQSGVFWKAEREFLRQMAHWRLADLDALQPQMLSADRACKTAGSPDRLIAERLAMTVAGRARRLGL